MRELKIEYYSVEERRSKINIPYGNGKLTAMAPAVGPAPYVRCGELIRADDEIVVPTAEQTAAVIHASYCGPKDFRNKHSVLEVRNKTKAIQHERSNGRHWISNVNLWVGKSNIGPQGVYVVRDLDMQGGTLGTPKEDFREYLEKRLEGADFMSKGIRVSRDGTVRFAPSSSYNLGKLNHDEAREDGFMLASYFPEGAEKLAEVARIVKKPINTLGFTLEDKKEEDRISALVETDHQLSIIGGYSYEDPKYEASSFVFPIKNAA